MPTSCHWRLKSFPVGLRAGLVSFFFVVFLLFLFLFCCCLKKDIYRSAVWITTGRKSARGTFRANYWRCTGKKNLKKKTKDNRVRVKTTGVEPSIPAEGFFLFVFFFHLRFAENSISMSDRIVRFLGFFFVLFIFFIFFLIERERERESKKWRHCNGDSSFSFKKKKEKKKI